MFHCAVSGESFRFASIGFVHSHAVLQHIVFLLSKILAELIPDVSSDVEEHLHRQLLEERHLLRMHRHKKFMDKRVSFGGALRVS